MKTQKVSWVAFARPFAARQKIYKLMAKQAEKISDFDLRYEETTKYEFATQVVKHTWWDFKSKVLEINRSPPIKEAMENKMFEAINADKETIKRNKSVGDRVLHCQDIFIAKIELAILEGQRDGAGDWAMAHFLEQAATKLHPPKESR
ncbi:MAG: hypothetical protein AAF478_03605 [Pseudomonadota bacterium]